MGLQFFNDSGKDYRLIISAGELEIEADLKKDFSSMRVWQREPKNSHYGTTKTRTRISDFTFSEFSGEKFIKALKIYKMQEKLNHDA
jgi:hypothetical protein